MAQLTAAEQNEVMLSLTALARSIGVTPHGVARFVERGGVRWPDNPTPQQYGYKLPLADRDAQLLLQVCATSFVVNGASEIVWDNTVKEQTILLSLLVPLRHASLFTGVTTRPVAGGDGKLVWLNLTALIRDAIVVTVLDATMVEKNKYNGIYLREDKSRFVLSNPVLMQKEPPVAYVEDAQVYSWAYKYFDEHEGASISQAMNAANNARIPPRSELFSKARRASLAARAEEEAKKKKEALPALPPEQPRMVVAKPKPLSQLPKKPIINTATGEVVSPKRPTPPPPVEVVTPAPAPIPLTHVVPEVPAMAAPTPTPSAPVTLAQQDAALGEIAKSLKLAMRQLGLQSVIMSITDDGVKVRADWNVELRRSVSGGIDL